MEKERAKRLGRALFPIIRKMKESGEWKSSDEIDWKRTAEALAPHVLRFREERGALNAKNYHKENSDCAVDTGEHGQHSTVVAAKTDSERV